MTLPYPLSSSTPEEESFRENVLCCQLHIGLVKAVQVLLQWPEMLRTVLLQRINGDQLFGGSVLKRSVSCSPLQPLFEQADLEVQDENLM